MKNITSKIVFIRNFIDHSQNIFAELIENTAWDTNMKARKTACFGEPYNYSEQAYDFEPMSDQMEHIAGLLEQELGFRPNNCLLNYYEDGHSKMGFHGDTIKMLVPHTGIAIVSLGDHRIMQMRRKANPTEMYHYILPPGSLFYMPNDIQADWQHGLPKVVGGSGRISMTFREMIPNFSE